MHAPCGTQVLFLAFLILCSAPNIYVLFSMFASASLFNCLQLILHQAPRSAWGATSVYDMSTHTSSFISQILILIATPIFHASAPSWWFGNIYMSACYIQCLHQPVWWHTAPPTHHKTFRSSLLPCHSSTLTSATCYCFSLCQSELRCAIYIAQKYLEQ